MHPATFFGRGCSPAMPVTASPAQAEGHSTATCYGEHVPTLRSVAGELYAPSHDGPHLFIDLSLPAGRYAIALYFVNFDAVKCPAHWRTSDGLPLPNRFRDYRIEIKARASTNAEFARLPLLAVARVTDFMQGVYQRFALEGSHRYTIKVVRQGSHNTVLSGVFVDQLAGEAPGPKLRPIVHGRTAASDMPKGR